MNFFNMNCACVNITVDLLLNCQRTLRPWHCMRFLLSRIEANPINHAKILMGFGRFRGEAFNSWPVIMLIMDYLSKLAKEADIISDRSHVNISSLKLF